MMNNTTNTNQDKPIDVAVQLFENGFTPIRLKTAEKNNEKSTGKEAKLSGWQNTTYPDVESVEATFHDAEGLGLLLDDLVVLDIDRDNIANSYGLELAELHGIKTHKNTLGRKGRRAAGAVILQSDKDFSYIQSPKGEVECLTGKKQKLLPPSRIWDAKLKDFDSFKWLRPPLLNDIQYVEPEVLKQTCNMLALLHVLTSNYPSGGAEDNSRDKACQLLVRLFKVSELDFIDADYTTKFINILAWNTSDEERQKKQFYKQYAKYKDCNGALGQLQTYWNVDKDTAQYILNLLEVEAIEDRVSNSINADDVILEELPARNWCMYRLMPAEDVMILAGDGGTGKTSLMIQICLQSHIPEAYFSRMFPFPDRTPNMFLLSQEDTTDELKLRVGICKKALSEQYPDYTGGFKNFDFESYRHDPLKLVRKTSKGIPEVNHRDVKLLQDIVGDKKLDGLILDPVSTLHIGMNENDNSDMDYFVRHGVIAPICEKLKTHVSLIAHVYKGSDSNDDDVQKTAWMARGATSLMAAARVGTGLNRISKKKCKSILGNDAPQSEIFELQNGHVHFTYGKTNMSDATSGSFLKKHTKKYVNKDNKTLEGMFYTEDDTIFTGMTNVAEQKAEETRKAKESVVGTILAVSNININKYDAYEWALIDLARDLKDRDPSMKIIAHDLRNNGKEEKDIDKSIANHLERMFQRSWKHPQYNREFAFVNMEKRRANVIIKRWLVMRDVVDEEASVLFDEGDMYAEKKN